MAAIHADAPNFHPHISRGNGERVPAASGRLKEMPAVMSQGETLEELQEMIRDAYRLIVGDAAESSFVPRERHEMSISL
jgi:predicted RNase H-like HicB family nuclease